ncbi:MAG: hypothetical protein ACRDT2_22535, partial [Natronosporangium sp.]
MELLTRHAGNLPTKVHDQRRYDIRAQRFRNGGPGRWGHQSVGGEGDQMLLRVRVTLPDRPGSLGQVARTLGVCGADIVQVVVLERLAGRAVDDFTMVWPSGARLERLLAGLAAVPGVRVDGVWP